MPPPVLLMRGMDMVLYPDGQMQLGMVLFSPSLIHVSVSAQRSR